VQRCFRFIDARRVVLSYHPFGFAERNYIFAGVFCGVSRAKDGSARNRSGVNQRAATEQLNRSSAMRGLPKENSNEFADYSCARGAAGDNSAAGSGLQRQ
jgi:hypothetical protein